MKKIGKKKFFSPFSFSKKRFFSVDPFDIDHQLSEEKMLKQSKVEYQQYFVNIGNDLKINTIRFGKGKEKLLMM